MSDWRKALEDLETATRELQTLPPDGPSDGARELLMRRKRALDIVRRVCHDGLTEVPEPQRPEIRARLIQVREGGERAAARFLAQKQQAGREWSHLRLLRRALGDPAGTSPAHINCKG